MLVKHAYELVGNTPLLELTKIEEKLQLLGKIYAKVEYFNPAGSVKDRIALAMINDAEERNILKKGSVIIEPTSGNTGIGLASIGVMKGYKVILTMPESMSIERRKLLKAYGAEIVLTPASEGMKGAIAKAEQLNKEIENSVILGQFVNPSNPRIHFETTGPEIYRDLEGKVDVLVAGVGTGGTLSGAGLYLKQHNPKIGVVAVEPESSPVLSEGRAGPHKIQGIGAGFVPDTLDTTIYNHIIKISNDDAFTYGKLIGKTEGILVGISAGAALKAAVELAKQEQYRDKNIVVILPDSGDRYLSTPLFEE